MGYNKIILYGNQICDYLYIASSSVGDVEFDKSRFEYVNSEPAEWKDETIMFSDFKNSLRAGDSELVGNLNGYVLRRKKDVELHTEYVATISDLYSSKNIIDYMVASNSSYIYYLYPRSTSSDSGIALSPTISKEVTPKWDYWSLLVVDESNEENVFYLNKLFKFELNLQTDDMSNNAIVTVTPNFTKYPHVQYAPSNYWSGGLTALCGYISCNDAEYIQTPDMIEELKALTTDTRRKFLKDMEGNIWEVKITSAINISTDDKTLERVKNVKLGWTEVGKTSGLSIINNPNKSNISWVLTKTGQPSPYIEYQWNEGSVWDNSRRWTGNDGVLDTDVTNIGRDLFVEEDDVWA